MKTVQAAPFFICIALLSSLSYAQESGSQSPPRNSQAAGNGPAGVQAATFSVSTRKDSLGNVQVGSKKTDSVTVTNTGNSTLTISNVRSTSAEFTVGPTSASLNAGASRKFGITLTPVSAGAKTSFIIFSDNGPGPFDTVTAKGNGTVPAFSVDRKNVPYGNVVIATAKQDSVTVTDTGTAALVITSITPTNARYTVSPGSGTIQPGAKSVFHITFTPAVNGLQSGSIVFLHNAPTLRDTVFVTGTGTGFSVNRRSIPYGNVQVGSPRKDSVTVTNAAAVALTITNVASTNGAFAVNPVSASIAASGSAKFYITFTPANTSPQTGNIVFTHNASSSPDTVGVSGTGIVPAFALNRKSTSFGVVALGSNRLDSVVVSDTGKAPLVISSVASSNGMFTVSPGNATIQPSQTLKFYITFTPSSASVQSGNIVFTHNAPTLHDTEYVSGTGGSAAFSVSRRAVPFGVVALGTNRLDSVVVSDTGKVPLVISSVVSSNGMFTVSPGNATIQPSQTLNFYLTFTPSSASAQSGNIVFTHNAPTLHDTEYVTGTGGVSAFSVTRRAVPFGIVALGTNRRDSVSVTDTGLVPLVISSVTSSNGTFTASPATATIQPSQTAKFYLTFTPADATVQTGIVVFTHNAPNLHDTVGVSGTGRGAIFAVNRKSVAFGSVLPGTQALDSVAVSDSGITALVVSAVSSTNGAFTVNPRNATIQPSGTTKFFVTFVPQNTTFQNGNIVFTHNAPGIHDTVAVSGTGLASLAPPVLASPPGGSTGEPPTLTLAWNTVTGAAGYWVQMATDSQFTSVVLSDSTLTGTSRSVNSLPPNTLFFWRVSTKNPAGFGAFSAPWTLATLPTGTVAGAVSFSGSVTSTAYRMFGLPGIGTRRVGDIFTGTQKIDWRILGDDGTNATYPAYYFDLTADSILRTGEGYWLLQKTNLVIVRTDTLPPLSPDGTYGIPLHGGWNIISNPFNVTLLRSALFASNGLPPTTVLWEHSGDTTTSSGTTFDPFKGYYFDNGAVNLAGLKIPYPMQGVGSAARLAKRTAGGWRAELVFRSDINTDRDNYIGIDPSAGAGKNALDQHEPPLDFDQGFLYFVRPEWDGAHPRFATDIRGALGDGQTWDFEVWNPRKGTGTITLLGADGIPGSCQVLLVNNQNTAPVDMRRTNAYTFQAAAPTTQFTLIVGSKEYADGEIAKLIPRTFDLAQNYPNPFNPSTTIGYTLPAGSQIRLEILTVLGQRVRLLDEGYRTAGTYTLTWDGKDDNALAVSSGIYFCRLVAGGNAIRTRKLVLVK